MRSIFGKTHMKKKFANWISGENTAFISNLLRCLPSSSIYSAIVLWPKKIFTERNQLPPRCHFVFCVNGLSPCFVLLVGKCKFFHHLLWKLLKHIIEDELKQLKMPWLPLFHKTIAANFEFTSQKRQGTAIYKKTNFSPHEVSWIIYRLLLNFFLGPFRLLSR